jgi:hypothetical protein
MVPYFKASTNPASERYPNAFLVQINMRLTEKQWLTNSTQERFTTLQEACKFSIGSLERSALAPISSKAPASAPISSRKLLWEEDLKTAQEELAKLKTIIDEICSKYPASEILTYTVITQQEVEVITKALNAALRITNAEEAATFMSECPLWWNYILKGTSEKQSGWLLEEIKLQAEGIPTTLPIATNPAVKAYVACTLFSCFSRNLKTPTYQDCINYFTQDLIRLADNKPSKNVFKTFTEIVHGYGYAPKHLVEQASEILGISISGMFPSPDEGFQTIKAAYDYSVQT